MRRHDATRKMRANLLRRRNAMRRSLDDARSQLRTTRDRTVGDSADAAIDAEYGEISSQLAEVESNELTQIDVALERIATGDYGVCDDCGRNIPLVRLQAVPYATLCIRCQRGRESVGDQRGSMPLHVEPAGDNLLLNRNSPGVSQG